MNICTTCRREIKVGQRVIRNYELVQVSEGNFAGRLDNIEFQHSNCYDADGPRYDDDGLEIVELRKGYVQS